MGTGLQASASTARTAQPALRATRPARGFLGSLLSVPLLLLGFGVALYVQVGVLSGLTAGHAGIGFAVAALLFVTGLRLSRTTALLTWPGPADSAAFAYALPAIRTRLLGAAILLGIVTFMASGGNRFTVFNVTTWAASVILALAACWDPAPHLPGWWSGFVRRRGGSDRPNAPRGVARTDALVAAGASREAALSAQAGLPSSGTLTLRLSWTAVALALVLATGAFLLFFRLDSVPREMTSDHAEKLLDVRDVLDGQYRIFFPRNTGREAFQFYLIALMTPATGLTYLTMKLGTAFLSFLALPFTFLLARVMFGTSLALLATAVMAMSRWHLQVARVGLRFPFPPLFGAAIFYFLLKAIRDRRRNDFLLCGVFLGLAQHTYTALRLAPLAVVTCIAIALAADVIRRRPPAQVHRLLIDTGLLLVVAGLAFMPLARYAVEEPEVFLYRGVSRLASEAGVPVANLVGVFVSNVKNAILMFNWRGDVVWVNTIPLQPMLDPISGALFLLGCVYGFYRLVHFRELPFLYLFILLFVGLLPSILALGFPQENPSTVRSGMALPVTAIIVSLPLFLLVRRLRTWVGGRAGVVVSGAALAALLAAIFWQNVDQYFRVYATQHTRASQHASQVGRALSGFIALGGEQRDVYILPGAHWVDWRLVAIEAGDIRWQPLLPGIDAARSHDGVPRARLYIVHPDDRPSLDRLRTWYPTAFQHVHTLDDAGGRAWYVTVLVPAGAVASTGSAAAGAVHAG